MKSWPKHPVVYEINAWIWIQELSRKYGSPITFAQVPREEWDLIADRRVDAVWFMGVWQRSPAGIAIANQNLNLLQDFRSALADYRAEDNVGSPYCVRQYVVDDFLGGPQGLAVAREELARRGIRLVLDFVPNHVAPDHPWTSRRPEYFIQGSAEDLRNDPASFVEAEGQVFACGRDPYFPAWPDVLQLNAFQPGLRKAVIETLADIADRCDGVRCDMAMLLLNPIFERTWGSRAGQRPATEYWSEIIAAIKATYPDFLFVAEAYWDLEWELQQQGFDYCYDKRLYDRLEHENAENVRLHLCADPDYQRKLIRFIENHDEPRALSAFSPPKARAAAVLTAAIPGAKLFHEGQFEGRKIRVPVFLGRRPDEPADPDLQAFYRTLLKDGALAELRDGHWQLCDREGWPDNSSCRNLIASCWKHDGEYRLTVVNLSDTAAQGLVRLPWDELKGKIWHMTDLFSGQLLVRDGDEMCSPGLYVDLPPWGFHVLTEWQSRWSDPGGGLIPE